MQSSEEKEGYAICYAMQCCWEKKIYDKVSNSDGDQFIITQFSWPNLQTRNCRVSRRIFVLNIIVMSHSWDMVHQRTVCTVFGVKSPRCILYYNHSKQYKQPYYLLYMTTVTR